MDSAFLGILLAPEMGYENIVWIAPWKGTESCETGPEQSELKLFSETANGVVVKLSRGKQLKAMTRPYFYQLFGFTVPVFSELKKCWEQPQRRKDEP